jgi:hypothetical protein
MENASGTVSSSPQTRKALARVALVEVKDAASKVLSECFRQFGIETVVVTDDAADRLKREKFEACVVRFSPQTEAVLESARTSPSNNRMVIYGVGGTVQDAMKYSRYGINAVFNEPIERPSALKLVRATQMLVLHEFRRYVRIPVITEVSVVLPEGARFSASSQEISSGGMSLRSAQDVSPGQPVEISFALLTLPRIWVRSTISWRMPGNKSFGVRFDALDERRLRVKEWIESYLEN